MSVWDDRNIEIALQRQQEKAQKQATVTPDAAATLISRDAQFPVGGFLGVCAIIVSTLLLAPTGGISAIGYVPGVFGIAARKREKRQQKEMWEASDRGDQDGINKAAASGCFDIGCMALVMIVVSVGFFCVLWGITL